MAIAQLKAPIQSVDEILELVEERIKAYADRNQWYDQLRTYYYDRGGKSQSNEPRIRAMNAQGRPMLRDGEVGGSIDSAKRYSSHRISGLVDDYAALKGRMPVSRVEPPTPDEQGQEASEKLTRYLYSTYELSRLAVQQQGAGHYLTLLGDVCYLLEPGTEEEAEKRVLWTVLQPDGCYPSFKRGWRSTELYDLLIVEVWPAIDIRLSWGVSVRDDDPPEKRRVITYLSPYQRSIVVGGERATLVKHVEWDLGFCPAQWVFNKPGGQFGMSDIGASLDQQDLFDLAMNYWADGMLFMTYGQPYIIDPSNSQGEDPLIGPGAPPLVLRDPAASVGVVPVTANPQAIQGMAQQLIGDMNASAGSSQVRQEGQMHGSIQTGRAVQASQGPLSTRIEAFHESLGSAWRELNAKTLKMQERAPVLSTWSGSIFGRLKGVSFQDTMSASEIKGWYRTTVSWETLVGQNPAQKMQVAAEGKQFGLWDTPYAMELVGVEDPQAMHKRVVAEKQQEMQMQQQQGAPGAGPTGAAGPPGPHPHPAPGGVSQPPSTPMIFRPPHLGQQGGGVPGGVPQGVSRQAIEQALAKAPNGLKGEVWAIGELALASQSMKPQLAITRPGDFQKVTAAVSALGKVQVRHVAKDKLPPEAVRIA